MVNRKLTPVLLALSLTASLLSACQTQPKEPTNTNTDTSTAAGAETEIGTESEIDTESENNTVAKTTESPGTDSKTEAGMETEANTETDSPAPITDSTLSLVMVGDILLHTRVEEGAKTDDGSYDFSSLFENTKDVIRSADLALVNQEVIIGGEKLGVSGYPAFNAPYEIADALVEAGFDVSCQATNHALDKGKKGLINCLDYWESNYPEIGVLGIHDSKEDANEIYTTTINGITIAILNYTYSTNGKAMPDGMPYAVDMLDTSNEKKIRKDLARADEMADFVIVCPHWGTEYEHGISKKQKYWTSVFLEEGVDLVLGTHPHVIEPVELLTNEETGEDMLVYYSLGNYVNWTSGEGSGVSDRMLGGMAEVTLSRADDGTVSIEDWSVEPVVCHVESGQGNIGAYFLSDYTEELADANEIRKQDKNFSLTYLENLVEEVWPFLENE